MIHPTSMFALCWNIATVCFVMLMAIIVPFQVSFDWNLKSSGTPAQRAALALVTLMELFFVADIWVQFRLAYFDEDDLISALPVLRWHYLRGWFTIDSLSAAAGSVCIKTKCVKIQPSSIPWQPLTS